MDLYTNLNFLSSALSVVTGVNIVEKSSMADLAVCNSYDVDILHKHSLQWDKAPQDPISFEDCSMAIYVKTLTGKTLEIKVNHPILWTFFSILSKKLIILGLIFFFIKKNMKTIYLGFLEKALPFLFTLIWMIILPKGTNIGRTF